MTLFEQCAARLAKDIDFLMLDRKHQEEDAAAMLELFEQDTDPLTVAALLDAIPGAAKAESSTPDPFDDGPAVSQPVASMKAPGAPEPWLARFKDTTLWENADLAEVLGYKPSTIQAYTCGRLAENFTRDQKDKLRKLCQGIRDELAQLEAEL